MTIQILVGDCRDHMQQMEPESIDSVICDPPYGLSFMGKAWDKPSMLGQVVKFQGRERQSGGLHRGPGTNSRGYADNDNHAFQAWCEGWAREALLVLKPGGYLLAFGGTRTYHRLAVAIEDAGFEIRDTLAWLYGQGFPKSLDVSKAIDKEAGAEREVIGPRITGDGHMQNRQNGKNDFGTFQTKNDGYDVETAPATADARQWEGWGTALKPAWEPIIMARKPLAKGHTVAASVLEYGTGAINVDGCRIGTDATDPNTRPNKARHDRRDSKGYGGYAAHNALNPHEAGGRWPPNVTLSCCGNDPHDPDCAAAMLDAQSGERGNSWRKSQPDRAFPDSIFPQPAKDRGPRGHGDTGGASRYFKVVAQNEPMVQYDCNSQAVEGNEWARPDHQASILAESDTPLQKATTASTSGTGNADAPSWPTFSNGSDTTDPSPMDSGSITSTSTSRTIESRTYNCSMQSPTSESTADANSETACGGSLAASAENSNPSTPSTGTSAEKGTPSTGVADPATSEKSLPINSADAPSTRFLYQSKAPKSERLQSSNGVSHPTQKPVALMRWLVRMVTPPKGTVLDPFMGSGSTGVAAVQEGFTFIGIDLDSDYCEIARKRIDHVARQDRQSQLEGIT